MERRTFFKVGIAGALIAAGVRPITRLFYSAQFRLSDGITRLTWTWGRGNEKTQDQVEEIARGFGRGRGPVEVTAWYRETHEIRKR